MCQQYEAEARYMAASDRAERKRRYALHESGEQPMTEDELRQMCIDILMAQDDGL